QPAVPGRVSAVGRFEERVALVTGAGRGIGRAVAQRLASEGAGVVVNDIDDVAIDETVALIEADGGRAARGAADVTEEASGDAVGRGAVGAPGRVDSLGNRAGG